VAPPHKMEEKQAFLLSLDLVPKQVIPNEIKASASKKRFFAQVLGLAHLPCTLSTFERVVKPKEVRWKGRANNLSRQQLEDWSRSMTRRKQRLIVMETKLRQQLQELFSLTNDSRVHSLQRELDFIINHALIH